MFTIEPRIRYLPATREQVVSIIASLNRPHIGVPGKAAQEVQAYVVGIKSNTGNLTAFVYLFLTESHEPVVYIDPDHLRVSLDDFAAAEAEAVAFVESMGFMLENLNFGSLPPEQQNELLVTVPCFQPESKANPAGESKHAERVDPPQVRLARFLAAF
jgi:hypothetical protein